jgi:hypothetical protein
MAERVERVEDGGKTALVAALCRSFGGELGDAALLPLEGPAVLITALCPDALSLRSSLDSGLALASTHRERRVVSNSLLQGKLPSEDG